MVKESLQEVSETLHDIQRIAQEFWPDALVSSFELLKGGYSATNYHIKTSDNREAVVKICRGYQLPDVENQAAVAAYLASHGFAELCHPYALSGRPGYYAVDFQSFPAIMVNYLPGKGGDVLIEENSLTLVQAASQIGRGLSRMHSIPIALTTCLRSFLDDGICFLGRHYRGEYKRLLQEHEDPFIREHDFVRVYLDRFDFLHSTIQTLIDDESSSRSILHGDAFVDNVLFDASTGRLL